MNDDLQHEPHDESPDDESPHDVEAPAGPPPKAEPVSEQQRIAPLDALRGFALMGILAMNIVAIAWPFAGYDNPNLSGGDDWLNRAAWFFNYVFFNNKMMSLFSMLFGSGLILMSDRAKEKGAKLAGVHYRRMFWLLIIGMAHAYLIWDGDILVYYALCGMLLYPIRRLPWWALLPCGVFLVVFGALLMGGLSWSAGFLERASMEVEQARIEQREPTEEQLQLAEAWDDQMETFFAHDEAAVQSEIEKYRRGYFSIFVERAKMMFFLQLMMFLAFVLWSGTGRMLIGMALMKVGVFAASRSLRFYVILALLSYGVGLSLTIIAGVEVAKRDYLQHHAPMSTLLLYLGAVPIALGHASVLMMICKSDSGRRLTYPLAAAGRMAFTNYLMHSLICTTIFYGYGLALYGSLNRIQLWGIVVAIWAFQLTLSTIWLRYFRYGPAEWLWRSLTYLKLQPMLVTSPAETEPDSPRPSV